MKYSSIDILDSQQVQCSLEISFTYIWVNGNRAVRCTVSIIGNYEQTHYTGIAIYSHQDQFIKSIGRKLALTRAIKTLPRKERIEIWKAYWSKHKRS